MDLSAFLGPEGLALFKDVRDSAAVARAAGTLLGTLGLGIGSVVRIYRQSYTQAVAARIVAWVSRVNPVLGKRLEFLVWANLTTVWKILVPVIGAVLVAAIGLILGTVTWMGALVTVAGVALTAIFGHEATKKIGSMITPLTARLPTPAKHATSLVLPLDPSRIPKLPS